MKGIIKSTINQMKMFLGVLRERNHIRKASSLLLQHNLKVIKFLGRGKDSISFIAIKDNKKIVAKVLSPYAKQFLPVTKDFLSKCSSSEIFHVNFVGDEILYYDYNELSSPNVSSKLLLQNFIKMCEFQIKIIPKGFVMWDFGISGTNYMLMNEDLKIIDYGGNSFLYLNDKQAPIKRIRHNLVYANNNIIQQSLLLHFLVLGIGQTTATHLATWIQDNEDLTYSKDKILDYLRGTIYEKLAKIVLKLDLTSCEGWEKLKSELKSYFDLGSPISLDRADIDSVEFQNGAAIIKGYQNYKVTNSMVTPLDMGHEWANTKIKWEIISGQLKRLNFKTYLDIGSNLGIYVFTANINCKADAVGVDYNQDYINICNQVAKELKLNCTFRTQEFSKITEVYDCVTMLGVIHHIYNRTESFGKLKDIILKLSELSNKYVIVEFPDQNDSKAMKWVNIPSRATQNDYTLENFINLSKEIFRKVELIDSTTKHRPVYLLEK